MSTKGRQQSVSAIIFILGCILSGLVYSWSGEDGSFFYLGLMPGIPFVTIAFILTMKKKSNQTVNAIFASVACLLVTIVCYGALLYDSLNYNGGGANIGIGLLLMPLPVYYIVAALIGWEIGEGRFTSQH